MLLRAFLFYIVLKLGSIGCLREGKTGEKPIQQGKNQRRNLDFGFPSLPGFRTPWARFWIPKSGIPDSTWKELKGFRFHKEKFPEVQNPVTFHRAKCSFQEADPRRDQGPLFLDRSEARRAKFLFRPATPSSLLSQGLDDLKVWIRLWC